jgi:phage/plasmid-associated DNA primase
MMNPLDQLNATAPDLDVLIERFGPPAYFNKQGSMSRLNDVFWSNYFPLTKTKLIYEPFDGEFWDYSQQTGIFLPKSADVARTELAETVMNCSRQWDGWEGLGVFRNTKDLAGSLTALRGVTEERGFFDNPGAHVHLSNCVLSFNTADGSYKIGDFSPEYRSRNKSPIPYDPEADCLEYKKRILGHIPEDDQILMQKISGQCLLGRNISQRILILEGIGGASKGAFILILAGIVGRQNIYELRPNLLNGRFEIGRMIGRTLLIGSDVPGNFLSEEGSYRLKSIVGGDPMEAEGKISNARKTIYGTQNVVANTNTRLLIRLNQDESAWGRRLAIVHYEHPFNGPTIPDVDQYILKKEAPGIVNWALKGLTMLYQDFAEHGKLQLSEAQQERIDNLLGESDSLALFVQNKIVRDDTVYADGSQPSLTVDEIIKAYIQDCGVKEWTPKSSAVIEKHLPGLMLKNFGAGKAHDIPRDGSDRRGYRYVRFRNQE